ncbi:MAG: stalk domain-containing protein [Oscillospiraceae bacterium]
MKKRIIVFLLLAFALGFMPKASAERYVTVTVDGLALNFDQNPIIENGRTLVPLRAIFEALGASVHWDQETKTVTAVRGKDTVWLTIGSNIVYLNGEPAYVMDVPAKIVEETGRTLVPARAVSEVLGASVTWNDRTSSVVILTDPPDHTYEERMLQNTWLGYNGEPILTVTAYYPVLSGKGESDKALNRMFFDAAAEYVDVFGREMYEEAKAEYEFSIRNEYHFYPYEFEQSVSITYDKNGYFSYVTQNYSYTGGAHPNTARDAAILRTDSMEELDFMFFFGESKREDIESKITDYFYGFLEEDIPGYTTKEAVAEAVESELEFYLSPLGVGFFLPVYSVAPYAAGYPEFIWKLGSSEIIII